MLVFVLLANIGFGAYQVYDVKITLTTTKDANVSLPFPLNLFFDSNVFQAKKKENFTGVIVCFGADYLSDPAFMYLRSSLTGRTYQFGRDLEIGWPVYNRLSPKDKSVEGVAEIWLDDYYFMIAGMGSVKNINYKRWWWHGNYSTIGLGSFKGNVTGYRSTGKYNGVNLNGRWEMGSQQTVLYGSCQIKFNKKYSDIRYKLSTRDYAGEGGTSPSYTGHLTDDTTEEAGSDYGEGEELSTSEIAKQFGL